LIYEGPARGIPSAKTTTWVEEVRASGDVSKECVKYLKVKNFIPSAIGFVGLRQFMPSYQLQFLFESLNQSKIKDSDYILKNMRMVKSERECNQIRRSCRILTHAFDFLSNTSFQNMNEKILEAMVNKETRLDGVEDFRMLIAKPMETKWAFRPVEEVQISSGDSVIIYLAVEFERYWAEGIRTFVGKDSYFVSVKPEGFITLYDQMMDGLKPGKKLSQFYKETINKIRKSNVNPIREYGLGQGIGLSLQEFPVITSKDETLLKEGMCLTLRLAVKNEELGAVMVGDTIHVSKNGPEVLTK
jgi:Xaa-Pro dipeptidase